MRQRFLIAIAVFLAFIVGAAEIAVAESPYETLEKAAEAMDKGDGATFQRFVDLDSLLERALSEFIADTARNKDIYPAPIVFIMEQASDPGFKGRAMRGLMLAEAKDFMIDGVSSGAFAGRKLRYEARSGVLAPLFSNMSLGKKEILGVGDGIRDGDDVILPFSLHDYGNDQDYAVKGRFARNGDSWRLTAIENLPEIFEQLRREALAE
ncbi:MAG: hypothetical protein K2H64_06020 [Desulfovibrio sp.]|nr:hypothetical protein [Desulfovibrio sp.]